MFPCAATLLLCGFASPQPAPTPAPVVSLLFPVGNAGGDDAQWLGSVISAAPTATTYSLNCREVDDEGDEDPPFDSSGPDCGFGGITAIQGPATYSLVYNIPSQPQMTFNYNCQLEGVTRVSRATCTAAQLHPSMTEDTRETVTLEEPENRSIGVTVTAGAEKLSNPPPTETATLAPTPTPDAAPPRLVGAGHWAFGGMAAAALGGAF